MTPKPERKELPKLEECPECHYVACICNVKRIHGPECVRRKAILDESPKPCKPHDTYACEICFPCNCRRK